MKICLLGATGRTGRHVLEQALQRGLEVIAAVRDPDKLEKFRESANLSIEKCDIFQSEELARIFAKCDVVVSALGFKNEIFKVINGYSKVTEATIEALRLTSKSRVVFLHSVLTSPSSRRQNNIYGWHFKLITYPFLFRSIAKDMHEAEMLLRAAEDIDWTTVAPGYLLNDLKTPTSKKIYAEDEKYFINERSMFIQRADVARFLLDVAEQNSHLKRVVAIAV